MNAESANLNHAFDPLVAVFAWRKHWCLALAAVITSSSLGLLAALQVKPKYSSEASLFVRLGRESAGLDPTATTSEITPIYETREQELNSALEVMQSRKLLEAVIGVIGEDVLMNPESFSSEVWQQKLATTEWPELDPETLHHSNAVREVAVQKLHKAVSLEVERSSSIIAVTSTALTPELAQAISRTLLDAFRAEHVRLNRTSGVQFFTDQVRTLQDRLETARQRMIDRLTELGVVSIDSERARLGDVLTALEREMNTAIPALDGSRRCVQVLETEVQQMPERTQPHDAYDTLRKRLNELEQQRTAMLTRFTERHPRVTELDMEISHVSDQLADPVNTNAANPTLRELEVALSTERARVAQREAEIERQKLERNQLLNRLQQLCSAETEILALKDRQEELKSALVKATDKFEQARMLDELSKDRISNIRIVQPPTFNPVSGSTSRSMIVMGGVAVGFLAAIVLPALWEFAAWYVRVIRSVKQDSNVQPVGAI
ncbi:MAG: hypothetical protein R3C49_21245 [Planctomycetaceae bacterium]